jgi:hypothetical protein
MLVLGLTRKIDQNLSATSRVKTFIFEITGEDISFDTAYRFGPDKIHYRRPIKVKFLSMIQRNQVYSNRNKTTPPFYINEALPYSIRRDNGLLRERKRQEIRKGMNPEYVKIDFHIHQWFNL